jgi:hypothetical protein
MGELTVDFIGVVRTGSENCRVLVRADDGLFYTWKIPISGLQSLKGTGGFEVPADELELATEKQIVVGRGNQGVIHVGSAQMRFVGLIQKGKKNFRVLVTEPDGWECFLTAVVPVGELPPSGGLITVDRRQVFEARADQIAAGTGVGKLKRSSRKKEES